MRVKVSLLAPALSRVRGRVTLGLGLGSGSGLGLGFLLAPALTGLADPIARELGGVVFAAGGTAGQTRTVLILAYGLSLVPWGILGGRMLRAGGAGSCAAAATGCVLGLAPWGPAWILALVAMGLAPTPRPFAKIFLAQTVT